MKTYSERVAFNPRQLAALQRSTVLVGLVADSWNNELRCHELARAVFTKMEARWPELTLVDGKMGIVEHSWLVFDHSRDLKTLRELHHELGEAAIVRTHGAILDVYCPGRMPSVQLLDSHPVVTRGFYKHEPMRDDIRKSIVAQLVRQMTPANIPTTLGPDTSKKL